MPGGGGSGAGAQQPAPLLHLRHNTSCWAGTMHCTTGNSPPPPAFPLSSRLHVCVWVLVAPLEPLHAAVGLHSETQAGPATAAIHAEYHRTQHLLGSPAGMWLGKR